jgi:flagellar P-ring protein FlgI
MRSLASAAMTLLVLAAALEPAPASAGTRIKDIGRVDGVRDQQLLGYGIVVGLAGTGDGTQARFTTVSIANMLNKLGISIDPSLIRVRNAAAVIVTANLPPFARRGGRLDVTVSSLGDATSLQGGTLLQTPLAGGNGIVYAVGQGAISLGGGLGASKGGTSVQKNHLTAGRIPGGALVERELESLLPEEGILRVVLDQPDFTTATRAAKALNESLGTAVAKAENGSTVAVSIPEASKGDVVPFIAKVEEVELEPDMRARVVFNERTGTVVLGGNVLIGPVAVAQGNLTVEIHTDTGVSQPLPFSKGGTTEKVEHEQVNITESTGGFMELHAGPSVADLVTALNALGVTARDIIGLLQAVKESGALRAELVIQ